MRKWQNECRRHATKEEKEIGAKRRRENRKANGQRKGDDILMFTFGTELRRCSMDIFHF